MSTLTLKSTNAFYISTSGCCSSLIVSSWVQRLTDAIPNKYIPCRGSKQDITFLFLQIFVSSSAVLWNLISGWQCVHQGPHQSFCADKSHFTDFFAAKSSSLRQIDDRYPLVHTAALSAESVYFAQSGVLPRCRMWALKTKIIKKIIFII